MSATRVLPRRFSSNLPRIRDLHTAIARLQSPVPVRVSDGHLVHGHRPRVESAHGRIFLQSSRANLSDLVAAQAM